MRSANAEHRPGLDLAQRERATAFAHRNLVLEESQVSIAAAFKTTQTEVSRLVRLAKAKGWVDAPGAISTQVEFLKAHARCGHIRHVVVVPTQKKTDENLDEVAFACARYVVERARTMRAVKLGLSCGNATRAFARAIGTRFSPSELPSGCSVYALNAVSQARRGHFQPTIIPFQVTGVHPNSIVCALTAILPNASGEGFVLTESTRGKVQQRIEDLDPLDFYVVGMGPVDPEGRKRAAGERFESHEFNALIWATKYNGRPIGECLTKTPLESGLGAFPPRPLAAGECVYQPFDFDGNSLFEVEAVSAILRDFQNNVAYYPLRKLRAAVADGKAEVIALAAGVHKALPIWTMIKSGTCNVVVTDSVTLNAILDLARHEPVAETGNCPSCS